VPKDFFTVEGATATNDADSGVSSIPSNKLIRIKYLMR
jgi:hypothetical protein